MGAVLEDPARPELAVQLSPLRVPTPAGQLLRHLYRCLGSAVRLRVLRGRDAVLHAPLRQEDLGAERSGAELWSSVCSQRVEGAGVTEDYPRDIDQLTGESVLSLVLDELPSRSVVHLDEELGTGTPL